jgi:hypothetical protein
LRKKQQQLQVYASVSEVNYSRPQSANIEGATELAMMPHPAVSRSIPDELVSTIAAT